LDWRNAKKTINLIRHEWDPAILALLDSRGPLRHTDIQRELGAADRVLSNTLKRLVLSNLVIRHLVERRFPTQVVYDLSPPGRDLVQRMDPLAEWARRYLTGEGREPE
jgi:DNA-binding HxlR family transcriptional regulator